MSAAVRPAQYPLSPWPQTDAPPLRSLPKLLEEPKPELEETTRRRGTGTPLGALSPSLLVLCVFLFIPVSRKELRHHQMTLKFRLESSLAMRLWRMESKVIRSHQIRDDKHIWPQLTQFSRSLKVDRHWWRRDQTSIKRKQKVGRP